MNEDAARVHSTTVAARFLELAGDDKLTQLQLQKLTYYANGWHIAFYGSPLTEDDVEAWKFGPVYRDMWTALRRYGKERLKRSFIDANTEGMGKKQMQAIQAVFDAYGGLSGFELSSMTHQEDSPWDRTFVKYQKRKISPEVIGEHFLRLKEAEAGK